MLQFWLIDTRCKTCCLGLQRRWLLCCPDLSILGLFLQLSLLIDFGMESRFSIGHLLGRFLFFSYCLCSFLFISWDILVDSRVPPLVKDRPYQSFQGYIASNCWDSEVVSNLQWLLIIKVQSATTIMDDKTGLLSGAKLYLIKLCLLPLQLTKQQLCRFTEACHSGKSKLIYICDCWFHRWVYGCDLMSKNQIDINNLNSACLHQDNNAAHLLRPHVLLQMMIFECFAQRLILSLQNYSVKHYYSAVAFLEHSGLHGMLLT